MGTILGRNCCECDCHKENITPNLEPFSDKSIEVRLIKALNYLASKGKQIEVLNLKSKNYSEISKQLEGLIGFKTAVVYSNMGKTLILEKK